MYKLKILQVQNVFSHVSNIFSMKVKVCILYMLYRHFLLLQIPTCIYTTTQIINIDEEKAHIGVNICN